MLEEALTTLAAAGGIAVVQAAGTDAWTGFRQAVANWFSRGDAHLVHAELERLDQTAATLQNVDPSMDERVRLRQEASWQTRIETALENLQGTERDKAVEQLHSLLTHYAAHGRASAGVRGIAAGGNVEIRADQGSIAAGVIHGGAHIAFPPTPDPSQG